MTYYLNRGLVVCASALLDACCWCSYSSLVGGADLNNCLPIASRTLQFHQFKNVWPGLVDGRFLAPLPELFLIGNGTVADVNSSEVRPIASGERACTYTHPCTHVPLPPSLTPLTPILTCDQDARHLSSDRPFPGTHWHCSSLLPVPFNNDLTLF